MATSFTPELGIRIRFSDYKADWWGTRAQLEAEGFIPDGTLWPTGKKWVRIEIATEYFCIFRVGGDRDGTEPNEQTLYRVEHWSRRVDGRQRMIERKLREALDLAAVGGPEWEAGWQKQHAADRDSAFQEFKNKLFGLKKRGRPAKAHPTTDTTKTHGEAV